MQGLSIGFDILASSATAAYLVKLLIDQHKVKIAQNLNRVILISRKRSLARQHIAR